MKFIILLFVIIIAKQVTAQQAINSDNLTNLLTSTFYSEYKPAEERKILSLKNKHLITKLNPITYLSAGLLFFYQRILSEQIQATCMYNISCSSFTKSQIEINGFKGFLLGINQLNNCFDGIMFDHEISQITIDCKVINTIEKINP